MSETQLNNKRIAKNTMFLYIRMLLLMTVTIYTQSVVLSALGVEDFGLYSLVGGIVSFLGFLNTSMAAASQRFLSYSLGSEQQYSVKTTFNSVFRSQMIIAFVILLLAETLGIYYIQNFVNCPISKIPVAHIVFQFSLFAFLIKTITVPYVASIIAHERMNAFAMLSVVESILILTVALILTLFEDNRIIIYAIGTSSTIFIVQMGYIVYNLRNFDECVIEKKCEYKQIKEIFKYSGWNLMGALSSVVIDQGVNMVLNSFFGVIVNAARGISFQVSAAVSSLTGNFQQAMNPQIVKSYAQNEIEKMNLLIFKGTKFSIFLLLILAFPIYCNIDKILIIWLGNVPQYTEIFCKLILINCVISALSGCILTGVMATGRIKKYQIIVASINILNLPISIFILRYYPNPYITAIVMIAVSIIAFIARVYLSSKMLKFSKFKFLKQVLSRICFVVLPLIISYYWINCFTISEIKFIELGLKLLICLFFCTLVIYFFGLNNSEKIQVITFIKNRIKK